MNEKVKPYTVENTKVFGDLTVTLQTLEGLNIYDEPLVHSQYNRNLTQQILDTPDFMALNTSRAINGNKRRKKISSTSSFVLHKSKNYSNDSNIDNKIDNYQYRHIETGLVKKQNIYPLPVVRESHEEIILSSLVDQLLADIYRYPRTDCELSGSESTVSSFQPRLRYWYLQRTRLQSKSKCELSVILETLQIHVNNAGGLLIRQLRRRDYLRTKRDKQYDIITAHLQAYSNKKSEDTRMRFSLTPQPGESGFTQWLDAMKMVARLPEGIPQEFRKRLWLTLAERHLDQRGVDWKQAEKLCFNEWTNPDDEELGIQIVKDLHRTGCSLFCGAAGRDNQAVLRRVLLGFARWNKSVGYCQGLNVLAALVLQVTDRAEASAVKVMIYLIEGVLPEGYFADNLRGLSVDMAVFRDLLRMRLPKLSRHLEALQCDAKDKATGSSYEPPLTNVFTMQWFLTLFCHCLPQDTVLRVWDLIFLEGDEVLLRTALSIWEGISDRIMPVTSADEFYSIMGVLTKEMLEFTDTNNLINMIVNMGPLHGITDLREKHRYNITPWARQLSDDEDTDSEDNEKLTVATTKFGNLQRVKKGRQSIAPGTIQTFNLTSDREKLALDISTLKQQYSKLRERQRQAHIILSGKSRAACARQAIVPTTATQAMNHLLVGKSALVSSKTRQLGPLPGAIPPKTRITSIHSSRNQIKRDKQGVTLHWKDTKKLKETKNEPAVTDENEFEPIKTLRDISINFNSSSSSLSRRGSADSDSDSTSTELCDEPDRFSDSEEATSISDYYITATDDEKTPYQNTSAVSSATLLQSSRNISEEILLKEKNIHEDISEIETSASIARITDQIRRLSAEEDNDSLGVRHLILDIDEDDAEVKLKNIPRKIIETTGKNFVDDDINSQINSCRSTLIEVDYPDNVNTAEKDIDEKIDCNVPTLNGKYFTKDTAEEILFSPHEKCTKLISNNAINLNKLTEVSEGNIIPLSRGHIELVSSSSHSLDISKNNEFESHMKIPISTRSNTLDSSIAYHYTPDGQTSTSDNIENILNPKLYVIGHLPISPNTIDKKFGILSDTKIECDSRRILNVESDCLDSNVPTFPMNYNLSSSMNVHQEKKIISPKSPESSMSVSSGETMGPDSKVSSIVTTPHSPLSSEMYKFIADKSAGSSVSSESKTLTLVSMESTDIGQFKPKLDLRSDIARPSLEQSTPSTPISTDSLKNKSELASPSKLIASSSSDSYNNSPGKMKCTERSFSSGLQSPISANSIKYTTNYRGQETLSESPTELSSATSPFYPIVNPNQKSPSPNRTIIKQKNIMESDDIASEKISLSRNSPNTILYSLEEMPKVFKMSSIETSKISWSSDDYNSARPFKTELAETLLSSRFKNEKELLVDEKKIINKIDEKVYDADIQETLFEMENIVSPLFSGKYDGRSIIHLNNGKMERGNNDNYLLSRMRNPTKVFERSCSSLDKRISGIKLSTSSEDFVTSKKRSSDILADLRHLEANSIEANANPQIKDTIMTRKTGYDWEDLKNLEARRQDNFSDSASEFSKYRLNIPSISVSADGRKSYVVEPKIQIDASSDSILKNYTQKNNNGEPDDDKELKLGVWTKVKPRKIGENGRRSSSDRALKIIQENSAILQKILTCQAKKCLPDLEEISKEITISPINEEISKIFSPILEKMGLNEHEINEELARINFKDFDQMTVASGSEFDAKINDELSKLSLIDDNEEFAHLDVDEMIEGDYLNTREALIDKQINEELSKLLANYEHEVSPISRQSLRDKGSLSQNPSEIEAPDLSSVSTNVFSYQSSNDSIETKSDLGSIQDPVAIQTEKFSQYAESPNSGQNYNVNPIKYELQNLSPKSDIDIYRELEKLDKISSARVLPTFTTTSDMAQTLISSNTYATESPTSFSQAQQSTTIEYFTEAEKPFETSPIKSSHHVTYKSYDYQVSNVSPLKSSQSNSFSRSYQTPLNDAIEFDERNVNTSKNYEYETTRKTLTKDNLEFRVRYDEENLLRQQINNDNLSIEPYTTDLSDLNRGASYYTDESQMTLKRLSVDKNRDFTNSAVSPSNYTYNKTMNLYTKKFVSVSPVTDNYLYPTSPIANNYEKKNYQLTNDQFESFYKMPSRQRDIHSNSPSYQFCDRELIKTSISNYSCPKSSPSLETAGPSESIPVIASEFVDQPELLKYPEVPVSQEYIAYRKTSMTLGSLDATNRIYSGKFHETPSPKSQFNPFPARTATRRPKELGLKLGLYSPSKSDTTGQSK